MEHLNNFGKYKTNEELTKLTEADFKIGTLVNIQLFMEEFTDYIMVDMSVNLDILLDHENIAELYMSLKESDTDSPDEKLQLKLLEYIKY